MLKDIQNRHDIENLVDRFYEKVTKNPLLGPIFNGVAKVDWNHHLPIMYNFWESLLLGGQAYEGNPMEKHIQLSKKVNLTEKHFQTWLSLFYETVDANFHGKKADEAKKRAESIAGIIKYKVKQPAR